MSLQRVVNLRSIEDFYGLIVIFLFCFIFIYIYKYIYMYPAFWKLCEVDLSDLPRASRCVPDDGFTENGRDGFSLQLLE